MATTPAIRPRSALQRARILLIRQLPPQLPIVVGLLVAIFVVGATLASRFGTARNLLNVFEQSAALGFVSLGQTFVILTGGIDLSIGALVSAAAMLTSGLINGEPTMVLPVVLSVLAFGAAIGALNGALTHLLRIHPLIITLGMAAILQGASLIYSRGPIGKVPLGFDVFAFGRTFGVPHGSALMLILFAGAGIWLRFSRLGRQVYAVGGDPEAARLVGISRVRVLIVVYAMSGFMAALTGIYLVSRAGVGEPTLGQGFDLASITPVVVGGTILAGGRGGVLGTLLGVLLISLLNNLLNFLDVSTFYQWIIQGLIIIVAVAAYVERRRHA
jgi:ribose transport system permease protein